MKLKFKQQGFQTDAVMAVADCFAGQPLACGIGYRIEELIPALRHILGIDREWPLALGGLAGAAGGSPPGAPAGICANYDDMESLSGLYGRAALTLAEVAAEVAFIAASGELLESAVLSPGSYAQVMRVIGGKPNAIHGEGAGHARVFAWNQGAGQVRRVPLPAVTQAEAKAILAGWIQEAWTRPRWTLMPIEAVLELRDQEGKDGAPAMEEWIEAKAEGAKSSFSSMYGPLPRAVEAPVEPDWRKLAEARLGAFLAWSAQWEPAR